MRVRSHFGSSHFGSRQPTLAQRPSRARAACLAVERHCRASVLQCRCLPRTALAFCLRVCRRSGPPHGLRNDSQPAQRMAGRLSPIREQEECDEASMPDVQVGVQGALHFLRLVRGKGNLPQAPIRRCSTKQASVLEGAPQGSSSQHHRLQQQLLPAPGGKRAGVANGARIQEEDSIL